jgi:hypothetical protein
VFCQLLNKQISISWRLFRPLQMMRLIDNNNIPISLDSLFFPVRVPGKKIQTT